MSQIVFFILNYHFCLSLLHRVNTIDLPRQTDLGHPQRISWFLQNHRLFKPFRPVHLLWCLFLLLHLLLLFAFLICRLVLYLFQLLLLAFILLFQFRWRSGWCFRTFFNKTLNYNNNHLCQIVLLTIIIIVIILIIALLPFF